MEADSAVTIFKRCVDLHKLRYTRYIGDGDTNSFKKVHESKPYEDFPIEKIEAYSSILENLGLSPGIYTGKYVQSKDNLRIKNARRKASEASLEARRAKRKAKKAQDEKDEDGAYAKGDHSYN
ncbi:aminopeptidase n [Plakobranchus ocellatus]|uniref:Aminopeptidase n n=1 Tax=Plakobranchus ocellatus TaxID=259542 RepID=A0AAV3YER6_9GAST|nr:aminopeptidase n [Plakobranchus ocellatus]